MTAYWPIDESRGLVSWAAFCLLTGGWKYHIKYKGLAGFTSILNRQQMCRCHLTVIPLWQAYQATAVSWHLYICCILRKAVKQSSPLYLIWHFQPPSSEVKPPPATCLGRRAASQWSLSTLCPPWTTKYHLPTLDPWIICIPWTTNFLIYSLGPIGILFFPWTIGYPLPTLDQLVPSTFLWTQDTLQTLDNYVSFASLGPLGYLYLKWTTRHPFRTLDHVTTRYPGKLWTMMLSLHTLNHQMPFTLLEPLQSFCLPRTTRHPFPTFDH